MRDDRPSNTSSFVAMARAIAQRNQHIQGFSDPVAERLLQPEYQRRIERLERPVGPLRTKLQQAGKFMLAQLAEVIGLRTVAIDEGIRQGLRGHQLVILGAGLDTRAWRLPELRSCIVYEVDHPATQRYKRERVAGVPLMAEAVRFVSVNFERDALSDKLAEAGHDSALPTVWLWEGVTMYLRRPAIEATLGTIAARSAPESRLLMTYATPSLQTAFAAFMAGLGGEPFRSTFQPEQVAALLRKFGFGVLSDENALVWRSHYVREPSPVRPSAWEHLVIAQQLR